MSQSHIFYGICAGLSANQKAFKVEKVHDGFDSDGFFDCIIDEPSYWPCSQMTSTPEWVDRSKQVMKFTVTDFIWQRKLEQHDPVAKRKFEEDKVAQFAMLFAPDNNNEIPTKQDSRLDEGL